MRAGRLDRRIELQSFALTEDRDPTSGSYTTQRTIWAEKMDKGGASRFFSEVEVATASRVYRIRFDGSIDPSWRVKDDTELWDIEAVLEGRGRLRETLILVSRHNPGDRSA